jgi:hypothetical protein
VAERRGRLAVRHGLAPSAQPHAVADVAGQVLALHSTDPASVFLSVRARMPDASVGSVEQALYVDRDVVRMLGMRRTVFVFPRDLVPVVQGACTAAIAVRERQKVAQLLVQGGISDDPHRWLREVEEATFLALAARGEATAAQLAADVPELRRQIRVAEGKRYEGNIGVSTRVLFLLAADGRCVRGRPLGSWTSTQYRWSPLETWLPDGRLDLPAPAARAELARRWLARFGPARVEDLRWWAGWTVRETGQALKEVGAVEVDLGGAGGVALPDDLHPVPAPEPWVALLPALDPTVMGWADRGWFLGEHGPRLFDRSGNAGPTVWWDGRIVGGWAQRRDGEVVFDLLEDIGSDGTAAVTREAARLTGWLGPARFTPRFRTPLERELTA